MACEYNSISAYLASKKVGLERIKAIELLIDAMILSLADYTSGSGSTISEYQLDDGQVKIKTGYRSLSEVSAGVTSLERMKQMYINQYNGRCTVLKDSKSFYR